MKLIPIPGVAGGWTVEIPEVEYDFFSELPLFQPVKK